MYFGSGSSCISPHRSTYTLGVISLNFFWFSASGFCTIPDISLDHPPSLKFLHVSLSCFRLSVPRAPHHILLHHTTFLAHSNKHSARSSRLNTIVCGQRFCRAHDTDPSITSRTLQGSATDVSSVSQTDSEAHVALSKIHSISSSSMLNTPTNLSQTPSTPSSKTLPLFRSPINALSTLKRLNPSTAPVTFHPFVSLASGDSAMRCVMRRSAVSELSVRFSVLEYVHVVDVVFACKLWRNGGYGGA